MQQHKSYHESCSIQYNDVLFQPSVSPLSPFAFISHPDPTRKLIEVLLSAAGQKKGAVHLSLNKASEQHNFHHDSCISHYNDVWYMCTFQSHLVVLLQIPRRKYALTTWQSVKLLTQTNIHLMMLDPAQVKARAVQVGETSLFRCLSLSCGAHSILLWDVITRLPDYRLAPSLLHIMKWNACGSVLRAGLSAPP